MLKQHAVLEVEKNGHLYQLHLPNECSLGEVHDVLFQMRSFVVEKILEAQKADQPKEVVEPVASVVVEDKP